MKEVISIILSLILILNACCKRNNPIQRIGESVQQTRIPKNANALDSSQKTGSTGILVFPSQSVEEYESSSNDRASEKSEKNASFSVDQEILLATPSISIEHPVSSPTSVPISNKCPQGTIPLRTKNPPPIPSKKEKSISSLVLPIALTTIASILVFIGYCKVDVKPDTRVAIGGDIQYITLFAFYCDRFTSLFHRKPGHVGQLEGTEEKQESARGEGESQSKEEVTNEEGNHEDLKRDDKIVTQNEEGSQLEDKEGEQESAQCEDVPLEDVIELCLEVTLRWAKETVEVQNELKKELKGKDAQDVRLVSVESLKEKMTRLAQYAKSSKADLDDLISCNFYVLNESELLLLRKTEKLLASIDNNHIEGTEEEQGSAQGKM